MTPFVHGALLRVRMWTMRFLGPHPGGKPSALEAGGVVGDDPKSCLPRRSTSACPNPKPAPASAAAYAPAPENPAARPADGNHGGGTCASNQHQHRWSAAVHRHPGHPCRRRPRHRAVGRQRPASRRPGRPGRPDPRRHRRPRLRPRKRRTSSRRRRAPPSAGGIQGPAGPRSRGGSPPARRRSPPGTGSDLR